MQIKLEKDKLWVGDKAALTKILYLSEEHFGYVMKLWKERISKMRDGDVSILPYSLDDEFVYAFLVRLNGDELELSTVLLDGIGFDDGQDDPVNWIKESDKIISPEHNKAVDQREKPFGSYKYSDFLEAVKSLQIES